MREQVASKSSLEERRRLRAFAAHQRNRAASERDEASAIREQAAGHRSTAARYRDEGARSRDDAASVRDGAARLRDDAARARDAANQVREEINRQRMSTSPVDNRELWAEHLELDRSLAHQTREALNREREASGLDRQAASKDRQSSERDRDAAEQDRAAADMDRQAAERDRGAAEADRSAADVDRTEVEDELTLHESWLGDADSLSSLGRVAAQGVAVIGYAIARLLQTLRAQNTPTGELVQSVAQANALARQLGEMRVETDTLFDPRERHELDLNKLIRGAMRSGGERLTDVAAIHFDDSSPRDVWGIGPQIERAIGHLLINAAQAMVGKRADNSIRVALAGRPGFAQITVRDSGCGISDAVLPHIFEPFFTTHAVPGAEGIGLTIASHLVATHGGTIQVTTEPGAGSTFTIELPTGEARAPQLDRPLPQVLVVEDDDPFARSVRRLLSRMAEVTVAQDEETALPLLLDPRRNYRLVFSTVSAAVDVKGLYERLSKDAPKTARELIFLVGTSRDSDALDFVRTLPNLIVHRPINPMELLRLVGARLVAR